MVVVVDVITLMQEAMIPIRKILLIHVFLYGLYVFAFANETIKKEKEISQIKQTIKMYNRIIMEEAKADRHRNITTFIQMMEDIATKDVARKLYIWIQSWHENGLFMISHLEKIKFVKIKINSKKAQVFTEEYWKYKYLDRRINKIVKPETSIFYKVRYNLIQKNNKWLISEIKVLKEKQSQEDKE